MGVTPSLFFAFTFAPYCIKSKAASGEETICSGVKPVINVVFGEMPFDNRNCNTWEVIAHYLGYSFADRVDDVCFPDVARDLPVVTPTAAGQPLGRRATA